MSFTHTHTHTKRPRIERHTVVCFVGVFPSAQMFIFNFVIELQCTRTLSSVGSVRPGSGCDGAVGNVSAQFRVWCERSVGVSDSH